MKLNQVLEILDGVVISGTDQLDREVNYGFSSDLMSDVLAYGRPDSVLLTGLMNCQVVRTAEMLDMRAIIFVRGKIPSQEIAGLALENNLVVMTTRHTLYTASGLLYGNGLEGIAIEGV